MMAATIPSISKFANDIAARQYYKKDPDTGEPIEDYEGMLRRVARHIARAEAIDAYKNDNGRYPEWYISFDGRKKNLLDLDSLDQWIADNGYTEVCCKWEAKFLDLLLQQKFSPAGRILAGSESAYGQLSNCFVLGPNGKYISGATEDIDSIDGIYELSYKLAKVTKTGGGCGISLSFMRESGAYVHGSGGKSSGPVSFLRLNYNTTLRVIKLEGVRRGAGMATMRIHHPDALDFITAKDPDREALEGKIESFNISLLITDKFMDSVYNGGPHYFISKISGEPVTPSEIPGKYHLPGNNSTSVSGNPNEPSTSQEIPIQYDKDNAPWIPAKWLWTEIVSHAWLTGDPGVLFIDRINDYWPFRDVLGEIEATNPCGEQPLWFGESCCLGSLVLNNYVVDGALDWDSLKQDVKTSIRFLDNVLTITTHPIEDTQEWCDRLRRVGLGVMGDAITMMLLGVGYDSPEAELTRAALTTILREASIEASEALAAEKGAFPFATNLPEGIPVRRNVHTLSIAPTGTISMICDTSSGMEPLFGLVIQRKVGQEYKLRIDPNFEAYIRKNRPDLDLDDESKFVSVNAPTANDMAGKSVRDTILVPTVIRDIFKNRGSIQGLENFTELEQLLFATAHDITPARQVAVQAQWQTGLDSPLMAMASISKTVNMSNDVTKEEVARTYELSHKSGLKGITMYRDGSRAAQVLRTDVDVDVGDTTPVAEIPQAIPAETLIMHRPRKTSGDMTKATFRDANGRERKVYVYIGKDDVKYPLEVFITDEDGGYDVHPYAAALGKMISMALKHGATPHKLAQKLVRIEGGSVSFSGDIYQSVPAMIGKLLSEAVDEMVLDFEYEDDGPITCLTGCTMIKQGGCDVCVDCGYSKCS